MSITPIRMDGSRVTAGPRLGIQNLPEVILSDPPSPYNPANLTIGLASSPVGSPTYTVVPAGPSTLSNADIPLPTPSDPPSPYNPPVVTLGPSSSPTYTIVSAGPSTLSNADIPLPTPSDPPSPYNPPVVTLGPTSQGPTTTPIGPTSQGPTTTPIGIYTSLTLTMICTIFGISLCVLFIIIVATKK